MLSGHGFGMALADYERAAQGLEGDGDTPDSVMVGLEASYNNVIDTAAASAAQVAQKLQVMADYFAGGTVPVEDIARIASELQDLV